MKLVGYLRVSTAGQVEDGQGLEIQEQAVRQWSSRNGHRLLHLYSDAGVSGRTEMREGLEDALSSIRFNGAAGLVVLSLDRLARSLTVQEAVLQQVWASGGRVFTVESGEVMEDDPDDPVRTFTRQVLGAVSQLEAGMIRRRLRRGRQHKAESGGYAHGAPRYGWRAEGGDLTTDAKEQAVLRRVRGLRGEGASFREIAAILNADGVTAKRGGKWHPQTVGRLLDD